MMISKITIASESNDPMRPFAHLEPIVRKLVELGNEFSYGNGFYQSQDGWRCDLKKPIDFVAVRTFFDLPGAIELVEKNGIIWCRNSWIEIQGGWDR